MVKHCLPGEGYGDDSWFHRLNLFEQQETTRQVAFKRKHWPDLEDGVWSKRPDHQYPHILPKGHLKKALYLPIATSLLAYLKDKKIAIHTEALNLRSSQVCCFNFLFPLREDRGLANVVLAPFLPAMKAIDEIEFEYTGPDGSTAWLGEPPGGKRGQNRTSIDAAIWWTDSREARCLTLLEWKYTEKGFGSCGGYASHGNRATHFCQELDASAPCVEKQCYLTHLNPPRRYWKHLLIAGIDRKRFKGLKGCPFLGPFYQLFRQSLVAAYLRQQHDLDKVEVASLSFKGNKELLKCPSSLKSLVAKEDATILDAFNATIAGVPPVRHIFVEDLMANVGTTEQPGKGWRTYIRDRYGV